MPSAFATLASRLSHGSGSSTGKPWRRASAASQSPYCQIRRSIRTCRASRLRPASRGANAVVTPSGEVCWRRSQRRGCRRVRARRRTSALARLRRRPGRHASPARRRTPREAHGSWSRAAATSAARIASSESFSSAIRWSTASWSYDGAPGPAAALSADPDPCRGAASPHRAATPMTARPCFCRSRRTADHHQPPRHWVAQCTATIPNGPLARDGIQPCRMQPSS
jgi:hypothetical protein